MNEPLEIVDLVYEISGRTILDGLSAAIPGGRVTALVGPNGAGKTTLLRCLSGEIVPTDGEVRLSGRRVDPGSDAWKSTVGVVPDSDAIFEELTVGEQLSLAATLFGISGSEQNRRVGSLLELSGLDDRRDALGSELSAGMRKRLAVALALMHAPWILLFDEPLSAMDYASSETFFGLLAFLRSAGRTVLISGHALTSLLRVADHVIEVKKGRTASNLDLSGMDRSAEAVLPLLKTVAGSQVVRASFDDALAWMKR